MQGMIWGLWVVVVALVIGGIRGQGRALLAPVGLLLGSLALWPVSDLFLLVFLAAVVWAVVQACRRPTPPPTRKRRPLGRPVRGGSFAPASSGYSHLPARDRKPAQRLLQRARNAELAEFVQQGNRDWARQQLAAREAVLLQPDREELEEWVDQTALAGDPFNF